MTGLISRLRSLWRGVRGGSAVDEDMGAEFAHHVQMRTDDLVRRGLDPAAAARQARLEFGSPDAYKDAGREARGLRRFDDLRVSWLDFKLGFRMLVRYPGLTLVGGLAMAFAIWVGAGTFALISQVVSPRLHFDEGDRIVGVRLWNRAANRAEDRIAWDFGAWRSQVKTIEDLGAFRDGVDKYNLATDDGRTESVYVSEISASAFRVTRVAALVGRTLVADDERPDADPVVVIAYDLWQRRFDGARDVLGKRVRIGANYASIVGVMPEGYAFPLNNELWIPLRLPSGIGPVEGPRLAVVGRLADGASMNDARAELAAIGMRVANDDRVSHEALRPEVLFFPKAMMNVPLDFLIAASAMNIPVVLLLVLICGNVALLMFARAASRERELLLRNVLGAGRKRIVMQLFAEALVLGGIAAAIGLGAAQVGVRWVIRVFEMELLGGRRREFWISDSLPPSTIVYAIVLTLLAAVIAGVLPGLKATRGMGQRLKESSAGGGGLQFGGIWTFVIVAQVAVTVAFPVVSWLVRFDAKQVSEIRSGARDDEYLTLRLEMNREYEPGIPVDSSNAAFRTRFRRTFLELRDKLNADGRVTGLAFADRLPRMYHPHRLVELDSGPAAPLVDYPAYRVASDAVGPRFFSVFEAPITLGRDFTAAEHEAGHGSPMSDRATAGPVIVNQSFVKNVLGNHNPIGRRIRYRAFEEREVRMIPSDELGPWYEIVGVVRDMGLAPGNDPKVAGIYHPIDDGAVYPAHLAVHVRGNPAQFVPRLRAIAAETDPTLRIEKVIEMSRLQDAELAFFSFWLRMLVGVSAVALVLSLAGIYSVMSFTVSRRTHEIGVRVALGATPRSILVAVFKRPFVQVATGIAVGTVIIAGMQTLATTSLLSVRQVAALVAYALGMMIVCLLACVVPTRRALRVQPTDALRSE